MKKFLPYILILIVLAGLFTPTRETNAQTKPLCTGVDIETSIPTPVGCSGFSPDFTVGATAAPDAPVKPKKQTSFQDEIDKHICVSLVSFDVGACLVQLSYYTVYSIPSLFLGVIAQLFNAVIGITLDSGMISGSTFIYSAWTVVRDLSNIFFILLLIYIGIQMILGIGGHGTKKMIANVIIMALLINFSMFFTKVIIDTSNILALIFYNKLEVQTSKTDAAPFYLPVTNKNERDISGAMVNAFDPTKLLKPKFFEDMKERTLVLPGAFASGVISGISNAGLATGIPIPEALTGRILGYYVVADEIPNSTIIAILWISGLIMLFAIYCFLMTTFSFLSRLIELWVLIIFSPFAFMSFAVPFLEKVEYVGWDHWFDRLIKVSFMAPTFMFFMYFIFLLLGADLFSGLRPLGEQGRNAFVTIIFTIIPALVILLLLHHATEFAKKASGKLGEVIKKTTGVVTGIAGGLALGGGAAVLQATVGKQSSRLADSIRESKWAEKSALGAKVLGWAQRGATSDFDARKGIIGAGLKSVSAVTGLNLGHSSKILVKGGGGYEGDRKRAIEKRVKIANSLKVGANETLMKDMERQEVIKQDILMKPGEHGHSAEDRVTEIDKKIEAVNIEKKRLHERAGNIHVEDSAKVALRDEALERARVIPNAAARTAAIAAAKAMNVNDPEKVKQKEAANAAARKKDDELNDLKTERGDIKNGLEFKEEASGARTYYNTNNGNITAGEIGNTLDEAKLAVDSADAAARAAAAAAASGVRSATLDAKMAEAAKTASAAIIKAAKVAKAVRKAAEANPESAELKAVNASTISAVNAVRNSMKANRKSLASPLDVALATKAAKAKAKADKAISSGDDHHGTGAKQVAKRAAKSENGLGRSINDQDDTYIPESHHAVATEDKRRMKSFADNMKKGVHSLSMYESMQGLGQEDLEKAIAKIRTGAKPEGRGDGHEGGLGSHLVAEVAGELLGGIFKGHGGGGGGGGSPKPSGGGGGGASHGGGGHGH